MNDILTKTWRLYAHLVDQSPETFYSFLLRANVLLLSPIILLHIGFLNRWRHPAIRSLLAIFGILIGLSLPLDLIVALQALRPWLVPLFLIGLLFLPHMLAFHLTPHLALQQKIGFRIMVSLAVLFIVNLALHSL